MSVTYKTEDDRKDKLFAAWNDYLDAIEREFGHETQNGDEFQEILEGLAFLDSTSKGKMSLAFESGEIIKDLTVSEEIRVNSKSEDMLYIMLGNFSGKWLPIEVVSIGSWVNEKKGEFHMSVNPRIMCHHQGEKFLKQACLH